MTTTTKNRITVRVNGNALKIIWSQRTTTWRVWNYTRISRPIAQLGILTSWITGFVTVFKSKKKNKKKNNIVKIPVLQVSHRKSVSLHNHPLGNISRNLKRERLKNLESLFHKPTHKSFTQTWYDYAVHTMDNLKRATTKQFKTFYKKNKFSNIHSVTA